MSMKFNNILVLTLLFCLNANAFDFNPLSIMGAVGIGNEATYHGHKKTFPLNSTEADYQEWKDEINRQENEEEAKKAENERPQKEALELKIKERAKIIQPLRQGTAYMCEAYPVDSGMIDMFMSNVPPLQVMVREYTLETLIMGTKDVYHFSDRTKQYTEYFMYLKNMEKRYIKVMNAEESKKNSSNLEINELKYYCVEKK